jgi:hypothetical protein
MLVRRRVIRGTNVWYSCHVHVQAFVAQVAFSNQRTTISNQEHDKAPSLYSAIDSSEQSCSVDSKASCRFYREGIAL